MVILGILPWPERRGETNPKLIECRCSEKGRRVIDAGQMSLLMYVTTLAAPSGINGSHLLALMLTVGHLFCRLIDGSCMQITAYFDSASLVRKVRWIL